MLILCLSSLFWLKLHHLASHYLGKSASYWGSCLTTHYNEDRFRKKAAAYEPKTFRLQVCALPLSYERCPSPTFLKQPSLKAQWCKKNIFKASIERIFTADLDILEASNKFRNREKQSHKFLTESELRLELQLLHHRLPRLSSKWRNDKSLVKKHLTGFIERSRSWVSFADLSLQICKCRSFSNSFIAACIDKFDVLMLVLDS